MRLPGVPYVPDYTKDEKVLGIVAALALHFVVIGPFAYKAMCASPGWKDKSICANANADQEEEKPLVSRPVVQASLLKLGKPIDPKKLPDRLVPQTRTAPKKQITASQEDPAKHKPDAGPPPPLAEDSDIANLVNKSDPFAEDAGKRRPEEGHESGIDGGTETDPSKVRAGDMYATQLGQFFGQHLTVPTVISIGEERRLCAIFSIQINQRMAIWYVGTSAVKSSGNELFDDAARTMLQKLRDDGTALPQPPKEVDQLYRGRRLNIVVTGRNGDASKCTP